MKLLGTPVLLRQVQAYVFSAAIAGLGGAVLAQSQPQSLVGLHVLSLEQTIDGFVLLALGGAGSIYGAILGAPVYMIVQCISRLVSPHCWLFSIGILLIAVVMSGMNGLIGIAESLLARRQSGPQASLASPRRGAKKPVTASDWRGPAGGRLYRSLLSSMNGNVRSVAGTMPVPPPFMRQTTSSRSPTPRPWLRSTWA